VRDVERLFQSHQYGEAGRQIYDFFWGEFADWYVEVAKLQLEAGGDRAYYTAYTLVRVMDLCLRLLHPFTPFITEELWGQLKRAATQHSQGLAPSGGWPEALIIAPWPEPRQEEGWENEKVAEFRMVQEVVRAIRNLRAEKHVAHGRRVPAIIAAGEYANVFRNQIETLAGLAGLEHKSIEVVPTLSDKPEGHIALVVGPVEIYLPLAGLVDLEEERTRLENDLMEATAQIKRLEKLLASPFAEKAPEEVVQKERDRLGAFRETAAKIRRQLAELS
jgi:valyl-tRNA synthetase